MLAGDGCVSGVVRQKWRRFERRDEDQNKRGKLRGVGGEEKVQSHGA